MFWLCTLWHRQSRILIAVYLVLPIWKERAFLEGFPNCACSTVIAIAHALVFFLLHQNNRTGLISPIFPEDGAHTQRADVCKVF